MPMRMRLGLAFLLGVAVAVTCGDREVKACSIAMPRSLVVDPQAKTADPTPPSTPVATLEGIHRGKGPTRNGLCGQSVSSCDDLGSILLAISATDDQTGSGELGFRVELASGQGPSGLALPTEPVLAAGGELYLHWIDGATDEQEPLSFSLAIRAVDRAGNTSPAATVKVESPGAGGCSMASSRIASSWAVTVVLILVAARLLGRRQRA